MRTKMMYICTIRYVVYVFSLVSYDDGDNLKIVSHSSNVSCRQSMANLMEIRDFMRQVKAKWLKHSREIIVY